MTSNKNASITL